MTRLEDLNRSGKLLLLYRYRGLLQLVAERCHVHPSLVSRVFHGKSRSLRVQKELEKALLKLSAAGAPGRGSKAPEVRLTKPVERSREVRWVSEHREQYRGQWVALAGNRLIAAGVTAKEVFVAARRAGVPRALIHRVESPDTLPFAGW